MTTLLWRIILAPATSWRAWRLLRRNTTGQSYDTAWRAARLDHHPDEMVYRLHGHQPPDPDPHK
ncbi:hypothetical protein C1N81_38880 [Streptomyces sp. SGAir0957]